MSSLCRKWFVGGQPLLKSLSVVAAFFQVGNNKIDDVNIIVFRQISQFDFSGNVITSSEYLSTLWVRLAPLDTE